MRLHQVIAGAPAAARDIEVTSLAYDNRAVEPGALFFCVPGFTRDGHDYAPDAIGRGAVALVVERALELGVPQNPASRPCARRWRRRPRRSTATRLRHRR